MSAEFTTLIWSSSWKTGYLNVVLTVNGKRRELRRSFVLPHGAVDESEYAKRALWYGIRVVERYKRWIGAI